MTDKKLSSWAANLRPKKKPPIKKVDQSPFIDKMHLLLDKQTRERKLEEENA